MQRRTPSLRADDRPTRGTGTHPGRDQDDHPTETFGQVPDEAEGRLEAGPEDRERPTQVIDAVRDDPGPEPSRPSGADELFGGGPAASEDDQVTSVIPRVPADESRTDQFAAYREPAPADVPAERQGGRVAPAAASAASAVGGAVLGTAAAAGTAGAAAQAGSTTAAGAAVAGGATRSGGVTVAGDVTRSGDATGSGGATGSGASGATSAAESVQGPAGPSARDVASGMGGETAPEADTRSDVLPDPAGGDGTDRKSARAARKAAKAEQKAAAQSAKVEQKAAARSAKVQRKEAKAEEKADRKAAAKAAKADRRTGPVEESEAPATEASAALAVDAAVAAEAAAPRPTDRSATDRPATGSATDRPATDSTIDPDGPAAGAEAARSAAANARRAAPVLLVVLLLVVAMAGGGAAWLFREQAGQAAKQRPTSNVAMLDKAATAEAVAQVSAAVEAIYSYDAASLDASEAKALALVTRSYADEFKRNFASVRALSPKQRASLTSKVVAAGVVSLTERRATMLVMVDQQGRRSDSPEPLKAAVRLSVTAQRADGQWKVSDVNQK